MSLLRQQPALREQIAQRASDGFESFALVGVLFGYNVVEYEMPVVFVEVFPVGEPQRSIFVLLQLYSESKRWT